MLATHPLDQLANETRKLFQQRFGHPSQWTVAAPGRVNLIGEHTDYNDGFVLPMAIDRYVVASAARTPDDAGNSVTVYSGEMDEQVSFGLDGEPPRDEPMWASYVRGVIAEMCKEGLECGPLQIAIRSTVPLGGGLSSSAALEVAIATLVEAVAGGQLSQLEKAKLCQKVEHDYLHMPCGIMDQFSSIACTDGHLLELDCRDLSAKQVPLADPKILVLIINSNVKRQLATSAYQVRRGQCETGAKQLGVASLRDATLQDIQRNESRLENVIVGRARHVVTENDRVRATSKAVASGDWGRVGDLMYESHDSLRHDYEVSCDELNVLVDTAFQIGRAGGVIGSRLTGAGFGGCTISLVETDAIDEVASRITKAYQGTTGIEPTLFTTRPGPGACVLEG